MIGKEVIAKQYVEREWYDKDGMILLEERRLIGSFSALENRWTIIQDGETHSVGFIVRLYAAAELGALLNRAGFNEVRFFGGLDGTPYDMHARRLVARAIK